MKHDERERRRQGGDCDKDSASSRRQTGPSFSVHECDMASRECWRLTSPYPVPIPASPVQVWGCLLVWSAAVLLPYLPTYLPACLPQLPIASLPGAC